MSPTLSIFQKLCPSCASSVPVAAARCDCGHLFDGEANQTEEAALRDEELYESYLVARATQAHEAARAAQDALSEEPDNAEKAATAELAREVARSLDADLAEQRSKIAALRNTLTAARPPSPVAPIAPAPMAPPKSATPATATAAPAKPVVRPATPTSVLTAPRPAPAPATPAASAFLPITSTATKAAGALAAIKNAKAQEVAVRAQQALPAAPVPATPKLDPQPAPTAVSSVPPAAFRAEQAAKAEKVVEAHKGADSKDCPNCTASVPVNATRCRCGFAFAQSGNDLPSLTLCTGDFTALRNSFLKS